MLEVRLSLGPSAGCSRAGDRRFSRRALFHALVEAPSTMNAKATVRFLAAAFFCASVITSALGQDARPSALIRDVRVGWAGVTKLGHWVPVRVHLDTSRLPPDVRLELSTVDSDAVPVTFRFASTPDSDGWIDGIASFGRRNAGLAVRLIDAHGAVVEERAWGDLSGLTQIVSATELLLVQIDAGLDLSQVTTTASTEQRRVLVLDHPSSFPDDALDLDEVDFVLLSLADDDQNALSLNSAQVAALWRWVQMGGRMLLNCGPRTESMLASGRLLERFAPGPWVGMQSLSRSDSLEFYAGSAAGQLVTDSATQSIQVATFDNLDGVIEVRQNELPLIVRRSVGFGEIVYALFDLEDPLVRNWKGNPRLLTRLLGFAGEDLGLVKTQREAASANYGFRDLSGQVRATGERFRGVTLVTFLLIAALIVLYAVCLGPLDYFLLQKFFPGMEWTWITSTLTTIVFAGIAWSLVYTSKPSRILINHTEILDIDAASSNARGGIWTNVFSPRTQMFDLEIPMGGAGHVEPHAGLLSSFGLPGEGIGGMESRTVTRLFRDAYTSSLESSAAGRRNRIEQVPIAVASTKQFFGQWHGSHRIQDLGNVSFRETGRQLSGVFRNPFDQPIRDAVLLYGNTVYIYGDVPSHGTIDLDLGTERSLKYFLQAADSDGESARWSIGDRNIARVFAMLMFFRIAGGEDFTGLTNRYQNEFDLSEQLALGRAVFLGRVEGHALHPLQITASGDSPHYDRQTSFLRVTFPVQIIGPLQR